MRKTSSICIVALLASFAFSAQTAKGGLLDTGQRITPFFQEVILATHTASLVAVPADHFFRCSTSRFDGIGFANETPEQEAAKPTTVKDVVVS